MKLSVDREMKNCPLNRKWKMKEEIEKSLGEKQKPTNHISREQQEL